MTTHWNHVVEIGAGDRASSQALDAAIYPHANRITLYEPNPILFADLLKAADVSPGRIWMRNVAVADFVGYSDLFVLGYASYLDGAPSFLATSVEAEGPAYWAPLKREVPVSSMATLDDGHIDWLALTNGGCELACLRTMVSRPRVIRLKAYIHNAAQGQYWHEVYAHLTGLGYRGQMVESNQHGTFQSTSWSPS